MATDFDELGYRRHDARRAPLRSWGTEGNELDRLIEAEIAAISELPPRLAEPQVVDEPPLGAGGGTDPSVVNFVARASAWLKLRPNRVGILEAVCRQVLGDPGFNLVAEPPTAPARTEEMNQQVSKDNDSNSPPASSAAAHGS